MNLSHEDTKRFIGALACLEGDLSSGYSGGVKKRAVNRLTRLLDRPLRMGLFGEAGSGKSSLLNILLRSLIFPAGSPGMVRPSILARYGDNWAVCSVAEDGLRH